MYSYFFSGSAGYSDALTPQIDSAAWLLALVFVGEVCNTGIVECVQMRWGYRWITSKVPRIRRTQAAVGPRSPAALLRKCSANTIPWV